MTFFSFSGDVDSSNVIQKIRGFVFTISDTIGGGSKLHSNFLSCLLMNRFKFLPCIYVVQ